MRRVLNEYTKRDFDSYCRGLGVEELSERLAEFLLQRMSGEVCLPAALRRRMFQALRGCPAWLLAEALASNTESVDADDAFWQCVEGQ